ncbi:hypothetical protein Q5752_004077 [Cryptotrichosporon argae]
MLLTLPLLAALVTASPIRRAATTTAATSTPTASTVNYTGSFASPHYALYYGADASLLSPASLGGFNRLIVESWQDTGASDAALNWEMTDALARENVVGQYHAAGIALLLSVFGAGAAPTTDRQNATDVARALAGYVQTTNYDGVDVDYQDFAAFDAGTAEPWLIAFQAELRAQLGSDYLISHAPYAPWFDGTYFPSGGYAAVAAAAPDIDFFAVKYYNASDLYADCSSLIYNSSLPASNATSVVTALDAYAGTALLELPATAGVPLDRVVLGKPLLSTADGYMDATALAACYGAARSAGWGGGLALDAYDAAVDASAFLDTVIGNASDVAC